jgi:exodeoxyribonuclease-3
MPQIKVASWNVNSLRVRLEHILAWLKEYQPDVLALQETKLTDDKFPIKDIEAAGYQVTYSGQKTYNGVAILSKQAPENVVTTINEDLDREKRIIITTIQGISIVNLYVPNGQAVGAPKYEYKLQWLEQMTRYIGSCLQTYPNLIVLGDFNIAPEAEDVHNPEAWENRVLFSEPEREALQSLMATGLKDCFRLFEQPEKSYTWWHYRQLAFRRNHGLRIDHILASGPLAQNCQECIIDKEPRGWERPSDHVPIMATFAI